MVTLCGGFLLPLGYSVIFRDSSMFCLAFMRISLEWQGDVSTFFQAKNTLWLLLLTGGVFVDSGVCIAVVCRGDSRWREREAKEEY